MNDKWQRFGLCAIATSGLFVSAGITNWRVVLAAEGIGLCASLLYLGRVKSPWKEIRKTEAKYFRQHEEAKKIRQHTEEWVEKYRKGQIADIARKKQELEQRVEELEKLLEELEQQREEEEEEHRAKLEKLSAIANEQLEEKKQQIFQAAREAVEEKDEQIEILEQQLAEAKQQIYELELPPLPEGFSQEAIAARTIMLILRKAGIICEFRGAWYEGAFILVRVIPRAGGDSQMKPHLEWIWRELDLAEKPSVCITNGAVQFVLKPKSVLALSTVGVPEREMILKPELIETVSEVKQLQSSKIEAIGNEIEVEEPELKKKIQKLNSDYLMNFTEPSIKFDPYGEIRDLERDWVLYLWLHHEYETRKGKSKKGLKNQTTLILRVWGAKSGGGDRYTAARDRLHRILDDAGLEYSRRR